MKKKPILFIVLLLLSHWASAQLRLGESVTTNSAANSTDEVVKIFDVTNPATRDVNPPYGGPGHNWGLTNSSHPNWNGNDLGQVFGIAINTKDQNHSIYVSTTQAYPQVTTLGYPNGYRCYPTPSIEGVPLIWQLDPNNTSATPPALVQSTYTEALTDQTHNLIFNIGTSMGNICYDKEHDQIFATNMEDGRIYRISTAPATFGNVLSRYDPFSPFSYTASSPVVPKFVGEGDRLWGIAYQNGGTQNGRLFFSVWNTDLNPIDQHGHNEIYSVGITISGEFDAPLSAGHLYDHVEASPQFEIEIPYIQTGDYSNPISDIELSDDAKTMLVAERTMYGPYNPNAPNSGQPIYDYWAHKARVLKYTKTSGGWSPPVIFSVGNINSHLDPTTGQANSTGGVDFGYSYIDREHHNQQCESIVWTCGDALKSSGAPGLTGPGITDYNDFIYGLAGMPIAGNTPYVLNSTDPSNVIYSYYQSIFGNAGLGLNVSPKSRPGDVDIYRLACCHVEANLTLVNANPCSSEIIYFNSTNVGAYAQVTLDGTVIQDPADTRTYPGTYPIPNHVMHLDDPAGPPGVGAHRLCLRVYSADPNTAEEWCFEEVCLDFTVKECLCDPFVGAAVISATQADDPATVGVDYTFTNTGSPTPFAIDWTITDAGGAVIATKHTSGTESYTYPFTVTGTYHVCMRAAYVLPGQDGADDKCCYQTSCTDVILDYCDIAKATDYITYTFDPTNYHKVTFHFNGDLTHPRTVVWTFGDGATTTNDGTTDVTHIYTDDYAHQVCMSVLWNKNEIPPTPDNLEVCCCYDQECITMDPCGTRPFAIVEGYSEGPDGSGGVYVSFALTSSTLPVSNDNIGTIQWTLDGSVIFTSNQPFITPYVTFIEHKSNRELCADVSYSLTDGGPITCTKHICIPLGPEESGHVPMPFRYYPNPTTGQLTVEVDAQKGDEATIQLTDQLGRVMDIRKFSNLNEGSNPLYVNVHPYSKGIYSMKVTVGGNIQVLKVTKD